MRRPASSSIENGEEDKSKSESACPSDVGWHFFPFLFFTVYITLLGKGLFYSDYSYSCYLFALGVAVREQLSPANDRCCFSLARSPLVTHVRDPNEHER